MQGPVRSGDTREDALSGAYATECGEQQEVAARRGGRAGRVARGLGRTRWLLLASGVLVLGGVPFAAAQDARVAARGDAVRQEVRNGTTRAETEIIGDFDAGTGAKGGYVTRQSNTKTGPRAGGGAIYGCRGAAGGTAAGSAPCLRASNLANGFAFEFESKAGPVGVFDVASANDAPFITDGGGVVTNLNADKVDGLSAAQLQGQQGPAGPAGPAGPRGPSDGVARWDDDQLDMDGGATATKSIDLPAGSWLVTATATPDNDDATPRLIACELSIGDFVVAEAEGLRLGAQGDPASRMQMALTGADTLLAAATAALSCEGPAIVSGDLLDASLTAVQVATLTTQP